MQPTHWLTFDCEYCFKRSYISMEEAFDTEDRFCPNCGISSEIINKYDDNDRWYDDDDDDEDYG